MAKEQKEKEEGEREMGESGSLVQPAGSAAFLSPEMGEQQSRNVPQRERGSKRSHKQSKRERKRGKKQQDERKKRDTLQWEARHFQQD